MVTVSDYVIDALSAADVWDLGPSSGLRRGLPPSKHRRLRRRDLHHRHSAVTPQTNFLELNLRLSQPGNYKADLVNGGLPRTGRARNPGERTRAVHQGRKRNPRERFRDANVCVERGGWPSKSQVVDRNLLQRAQEVRLRSTLRPLRRRVSVRDRLFRSLEFTRRANLNR